MDDMLLHLACVGCVDLFVRVASRPQRKGGRIISCIVDRDAVLVNKTLRSLYWQSIRVQHGLLSDHDLFPTSLHSHRSADIIFCAELGVVAQRRWWSKA